MGVARASSEAGGEHQACHPHPAQVVRTGEPRAFPPLLSGTPLVCVCVRVRVCVCSGRTAVTGCAHAQHAGRSRAEEGVATKAARTIMEGISSERLASALDCCF